MINLTMKKYSSAAFFFFVVVAFFYRVPQTLMMPSHELWLLSFQPTLTAYEKLKVRVIFSFNPDLNYTKNMDAGFGNIKISTMDNLKRVNNSYILELHDMSANGEG